MGPILQRTMPSLGLVCKDIPGVAGRRTDALSIGTDLGIGSAFPTGLGLWFVRRRLLMTVWTDMKIVLDH